MAATVAVDRRAPVKSSRSTLATMADLEPYLAALFGREAVPTCPDCGVEAVDTSPRDAAAKLARDARRRAARSSAMPSHVEDAEQFLELRESLAKDGYRRLVVAGAVREIDDVRPERGHGPGRARRGRRRPRERRRGARPPAAGGHRGRVDAERRARRAARRGRAKRRRATRRRARHGRAGPGVPEVRPRVRAAAARPLLVQLAARRVRSVPRLRARHRHRLGQGHPGPRRKSIGGGAIKPWSGPSTTWERGILEQFCKKREDPARRPLGTGSGDAARGRSSTAKAAGTTASTRACAAWFEWLETRTYKMHVRVLLSRYREYALCTACKGSRLNKTARAYRVAGLDLGGWHALTVRRRTRASTR